MEFLEAGDKIKVEGPPEEVEKAREALESQTRDLIANYAFVEINVDAKYHKHIIGKGGSTGKQTILYECAIIFTDDNLMRVV